MNNRADAPEYFVGLISGTSVDGIDAVLASFQNDRCSVIHALTAPFDTPLRERIEALIGADAPHWNALGTLDVDLGHAFAEAALELLSQAGIAPQEVTAIGHHGQTVHHAPDASAPFTIQIADPNTVALRTGITTVADLRRADMAAGGQGAPLVPAFHNAVLRSDTEARVIVNIGGISNITTLAPEAPITGGDTGPGNTLLDAWIAEHRNAAYDDQGAWGASGRVNVELLAGMLSEPWFARPLPKSTGRELFNRRWLDKHLRTQPANIAPEDVQATLAELTAATIVTTVEQALPQCQRLIVCGGGAFNPDLLQRLRNRFGGAVDTTAEHGIAPQWVEGIAFAWLARARLRGEPGNVPTVTGARRPVILGGIYSS